MGFAYFNMYHSLASLCMQISYDCSMWVVFVDAIEASVEPNLGWKSSSFLALLRFNSSTPLVPLTNREVLEEGRGADNCFSYGMLSAKATCNSHVQDSSYFLGWEEYEKNLYHPLKNPNGVIQLWVSLRIKSPWTFFNRGLSSTHIQQISQLVSKNLHSSKIIMAFVISRK
ncbi:hypothetical protein L1987_34243 [Smallanthus sonchifolius]|uniref:Uncharacterized protein n=1 Tax=Smallanthus sonchifolius TaxID=185202 RepID=A0ACB9HUS9_9ASTR|nr:hypothetical protein L1987_34243 [Smallanthus sonchifolius]